MSEELFSQTKKAVLDHVQATFEEIEESMAMMHQEKLSLLEDAFENANDTDELRIAFEQWHRDHAHDIELEETVDDLWDAALALAEEQSDGMEYDEFEDEEEDEEELID